MRAARLIPREVSTVQAAFGGSIAREWRLLLAVLLALALVLGIPSFDLLTSAPWPPAELAAQAPAASGGPVDGEHSATSFLPGTELAASPTDGRAAHAEYFTTDLVATLTAWLPARHSPRTGLRKAPLGLPSVHTQALSIAAGLSLFGAGLALLSALSPAAAVGLRWTRPLRAPPARLRPA